MNFIKKEENIKFDFFPYQPYQAQQKFMEECYKGLKDKDVKVMLMESPTGTGKTLMMLSAAFKLLEEKKEEKRKEKEQREKKENKNEKEDDWLSAFDDSNSITENIVKKKVDKVDLLYTKIKNEMHIHCKKDKMIIDDDPYNSNEYDAIESNPEQIFICTRTHSQITQIISEIKKIQSYMNNKLNTPFPFSISFFASRKFLCINKEINTSSVSISNLNSQCKELNDSSKKCKFHLAQSEVMLSNDVLSKVFDIEDIVKQSKEFNACPFFAQKRSILQSDIVIMPYTNMLSRSIRASLHLDLKDKIIFFDEAHNIIDSVLSISNSEISFESVLSFHFGIALYYEKYSNRLKSSNNLNLRQLMRICEAIEKWIQKQKSEIDERILLSDFIINANIPSYDLYKLVKFAEDAELSDKIKWSYIKMIKENEGNIRKQIEKNYFNKTKDIIEKYKDSELYSNYITNDSCNRMILFIKGITNIDSDGVIIITKEKKIKFQMINPKREFAPLMKDAKKILFAGGTMQPFDDFYNLFSLPKEFILSYEGEHVISSDHILPFTISNDIYNNNELFQLTYEQMNKKRNQYYHTILQCIQSYYTLLQKRDVTYPKCGIAVFFQSYDFIFQLIKYNDSSKILEKENLFYENSKSKENVFDLYRNNISINKRNSILFAVIGGKLSEGINFSDDIARILIVIGMPYSNIQSIEIKEKMHFYNVLYAVKKSTINGSDYYDNLCMKNVNQTIGRCIRHYNDYAVAILFDRRYQSEKIKKKLPKWFTRAGLTNIENKSQFNEHLNQIEKYLNKMHSQNIN